MRYISRLGLSILFIVSIFNQTGQASSTSFPITKIDRKGIVTVIDLKSKQVFQFQVADPKLLESLKVGQLVYPDFPNRKVSLDGRNLCCMMLNMPTATIPIEGNRLPSAVEPMPFSPEMKRISPFKQPVPAPAAPQPIPQR